MSPGAHQELRFSPAPYADRCSVPAFFHGIVQKVWYHGLAQALSRHLQIAYFSAADGERQECFCRNC